MPGFWSPNPEGTVWSPEKAGTDMTVTSIAVAFGLVAAFRLRNSCAMSGRLTCFFGILCALCQIGPAAEAAADIPGYWSVLPGWQSWQVTSAYQVGFEGSAELAVACGPEGQPLMGVLTDGAEPPDGDFERPAKIGERHFLIAWTGQAGLALTRPDAEFLAAMRMGATLVLYDYLGAPVDFRLSGAADALDSALAGCPPPLAVRPDPAAMRRTFDETLKARIDRECRALGRSGAEIGSGAVRERLLPGSAYPEVTVDFSYVSCRAGPRLHRDFCTEAGCARQRYLPGASAYVLIEDGDPE